MAVVPSRGAGVPPAYFGPGESFDMCRMLSQRGDAISCGVLRTQVLACALYQSLYKAGKMFAPPKLAIAARQWPLATDN